MAVHAICRSPGCRVRRTARPARLIAACCMAAVCAAPAWGQEAPGSQAPLRIGEARFGELRADSGVASGSVVLDPSGERRVIVSGRLRPEIWKIGPENEVQDTGYFVSVEGRDVIRVEWEGAGADELPVLTAGVLPWKATGERFAAFRLGDWLVARDDEVALPFFGRESVGFRFRAAGVLEVALEDGGKAAGSWWWSRGRLHLRFEGLDEVGTYEWRALAARVGWTEDSEAPALAGPSVRPLAVAGGGTPPSRSLPGAAAACPRDVLARLLASAAERSDVVSALAIEKETLQLCAERQGLVVDIVKLDRQLEAAVLDRREKERKARSRPSLKSVAQLSTMKAPSPPPKNAPPAAAEAPPARVPAAQKPAQGVAPRGSPRGIPKPVEAKASYSWFSLLGRRGRLLAGVTDGTRTWFVSVGDVLPRGGVVKRISGMPPGVEVAGLGLLPWTGKPVFGGRSVGAVGQGPQAPVPEQADSREASAGRDDGLQGKARVIDGDTLELAGVRVRLWGIDALEKRQSCRSERKTWSCGGLAQAALRSRATDLRCQEKGKDRYGRVLAVCFEGRDDVNAWLVSEGWALAYREFAKAYVPRETEAKAQKRGMHRGEFVAPWEWRRGKRLPPLEAEASGAGDAPSRERDELPPLPEAGDSR